LIGSNFQLATIHIPLQFRLIQFPKMYNLVANNNLSTFRIASSYTIKIRKFRWSV